MRKIKGIIPKNTTVPTFYYILHHYRHEAPLINQRGFLVSPKLQKRSALKFAGGRTIPDA